ASGAALASSVSTAGKTLPQGATPYAAERTAQSFIPLDIAIGVPADLLRRRPDVRQAEQEAAAQCARIGINKAALFPSFSISGFLGFQGSDVGAFTLRDTFSHNAFTASASPSLVLPFLNYGRLYNAVRAQDAVFQQSLVTYKQTVLQALQEAENAMSSFIRSRQRLTLLQQAAEAAGRSTKLALEQYNAGSTDLPRSSAQTTQYQQETAAAAAAGNTALQAVALFRPGRRLAAPALLLPKATIDAMKSVLTGAACCAIWKASRCRAVRDPTSRNAQRLLICTAATPKHPFAKIPLRARVPPSRTGDRCGLLPCSGRLQRHAA
ncbi:MAG: TolC family protein, partial [Bilophila wadsworthia]